ncbi:hypothetical protein RF11_08694 [Thelohanellus kitauei]|uniref:Uncharacterized protein n=1 Tax=Thelohanellus kitauei TaxID=669202 RepID=A0A0C2IT07_THEKT|nr:hypothetical protein RF11_08694 [Thelohanellus kitauei]
MIIEVVLTLSLRLFTQSGLEIDIRGSCITLKSTMLLTGKFFKNSKDPTLVRKGFSELKRFNGKKVTKGRERCMNKSMTLRFNIENTYWRLEFQKYDHSWNITSFKIEFDSHKWADDGNFSLILR